MHFRNFLLLLQYNLNFARSMKWACLELKLEKMWSKLILVSLAVFFLGVLFRWNTGVDLKGLVYLVDPLWLPASWCLVVL